MSFRSIRKFSGFSLFVLFAPIIQLFAQNPRLPPGLAAPSDIRRMPSFSLPDVNGGTIRSADLVGKIAVIRFWATH